MHPREQPGPSVPQEGLRHRMPPLIPRVKQAHGDGLLGAKLHHEIRPPLRLAGPERRGGHQRVRVVEVHVPPVQQEAHVWVVRVLEAALLPELQGERVREGVLLGGVRDAGLGAVLVVQGQAVHLREQQRLGLGQQLLQSPPEQRACGRQEVPLAAVRGHVGLQADVGRVEVGAQQTEGGLGLRELGVGRHDLRELGLNRAPQGRAVDGCQRAQQRRVVVVDAGHQVRLGHQLVQTGRRGLQRRDQHLLRDDPPRLPCALRTPGPHDVLRGRHAEDRDAVLREPLADVIEHAAEPVPVPQAPVHPHVLRRPQGHFGGDLLDEARLPVAHAAGAEPVAPHVAVPFRHVPLVDVRVDAHHALQWEDLLPRQPRHHVPLPGAHGPAREHDPGPGLVHRPTDGALDDAVLPLLPVPRVLHMVPVVPAFADVPEVPIALTPLHSVAMVRVLAPVVVRGDVKHRGVEELAVAEALQEDAAVQRPPDVVGLQQPGAGGVVPLEQPPQLRLRELHAYLLTEALPVVECEGPVPVPLHDLVEGGLLPKRRPAVEVRVTVPAVVHCEAPSFGHRGGRRGVLVQRPQ
mmetsp:Transcript_44045/g.74237  ORF Transcript_44045/g.74237 Transcript_44045/m.74237 type:complete len:576 (-) Transcript_44045:218-1945(-)